MSVKTYYRGKGREYCEYRKSLRFSLSRFQRKGKFESDLFVRFGPNLCGSRELYRSLGLRAEEGVGL